MLTHNDQLNLLRIGVIIKTRDPDINMDDFKNMEELRIYLNNKFNINIIFGMYLSQVLKEIQK